MRILAFGLACAASLYGQRHFSWQNACFFNPAAPYCPGHDFAIKPHKPAKNAPSSGAVADSDPIPATPEIVTPSVIVAGAVDWRFADPLADLVVGLNPSGLATSPLSRGMIARLGASQGLSEADLRKIFEGLSSLSRIALSMHNDRIVVMITGRATDSTLPALDAGLKAVPVAGNAMLIGHADAVDQALQRITTEGPPAELTRLAQEWQTGSEFWAAGSAALAGPETVSSGMKRFWLTASIRDRFASNVALEFDSAPDANALRMWPATLGNATIEGNAIQVRMYLEADQLQQRFDDIAASPLGQRLAALVKAARYLPARDTTQPKQTKPVIYGLDSGPKELK